MHKLDISACKNATISKAIDFPKYYSFSNLNIIHNLSTILNLTLHIEGVGRG
ncbi:hypothetical protein Lalb_Chr21g0310401 [Lupinus albus]|uniref:Uncharacterized protein n=1 Tax=Lupinus albus TaxID=3870 RepID=A0A6A4NQA2_LUPAL|nr:hypothetical protein Lalb_Chr21g0310401 [Lupinus albus]